MNARDSRQEKLFCPLEDDVVDVRSFCEQCGLWDGRICYVGDMPTRAGKLRRMYRSVLKRLSKRRRRFGKRGRGLRVPLVWEKWSRNGPETEEPLVPEEKAEYGTVELFEPEEFLNELEKEKEEYILPELIKEYWDVKPDVPDWIGEGDRGVAPEPDLLGPPLSNDPEPGIPPGPADLGPVNDNPPFGSGGFPSGDFGSAMP